MAGRIPQHFIDELMARTDIVEIIGARLQLRKAGREYKALCPFHGEKTPSFTISPTKQFYHCFGCGAHGTALGFLMEHDHLEFVEAVEELANRAGLEVPREEGARLQSGGDLYGILAAADRHYRKALRDSALAKSYLQERGVAGETAARFGIGYATNAWDDLLGALGTSEPARRELAQAGLIVARTGAEQGYYDRFRGRIMFPIRDARGRTIGFGGRIIGEGEPKYLNSPETPLFHKGRELYGLYEARQASRDLRRLFVVEGYMDVVALSQHGMTEVVATLGTATTAEHLTRLFRLVNEVVFCFDGDRAGRQAAWRALETSLAEIRDGRQIRFLFLPDGEDPDSLVRREGAEAFQARFAGANSLPELLVDQLLEGIDDPNGPEGQARLVELARPLYRQIPPSTYRELVIEAIAHRIPFLDSQRLARQLSGELRGRSAPLRSRSPGRGNLVRQAIVLLLQQPALAPLAPPLEALRQVERKGVPLLVELVEAAAGHPHITTAGLLERWRGRPEHPHLERLAGAEPMVGEQAAEAEFRAALQALIDRYGPESRWRVLLAKPLEQLSSAEREELRALQARRAGRSQPQ